MLIISVVLLASVFPVELFPNTGPCASRRRRTIQRQARAGRGRHGSGPEGRRKRQGRFLGRTVSLFPNPAVGGTGYIGLLGIDLQDEPGAHELTVDAQLGEQTRHFSFRVLVVKESSQWSICRRRIRWTSMKAAARWKAEQEQVRKALAEESAMRLWQTGFIEPVHGKRTGIFGSVRIMNGQPRNPHNGEDIGAPMEPTSWPAMTGVVRPVVDHIFFRTRHLCGPWPRTLFDVFSSVRRAGEGR